MISSISLIQKTCRMNIINTKNVLYHKKDLCIFDDPFHFKNHLAFSSSSNWWIVQNFDDVSSKLPTISFHSLPFHILIFKPLAVSVEMFQYLHSCNAQRNVSQCLPKIFMFTATERKIWDLRRPPDIDIIGVLTNHAAGFWAEGCWRLARWGPIRAPDFGWGITGARLSCGDGSSKLFTADRHWWRRSVV